MRMVENMREHTRMHRRRHRHRYTQATRRPRAHASNTRRTYQGHEARRSGRSIAQTPCIPSRRRLDLRRRRRAITSTSRIRRCRQMILRGSTRPCLQRRRCGDPALFAPRRCHRLGHAAGVGRSLHAPQDGHGIQKLCLHLRVDGPALVPARHAPASRRLHRCLSLGQRPIRGARRGGRGDGGQFGRGALGAWTLGAWLGTRHSRFGGGLALGLTQGPRSESGTLDADGPSLHGA